MDTGKQMQQEKNHRAMSIVVAHTLGTLPDSLMRRRRLLEALAVCMPPGMEYGVTVRTMRFHLEELDKPGVEPWGPSFPSEI